MPLTNLERLRLNINDNYREFQDSQAGDGSSIHFRLSSYPISANSQQVYLAGTLQTETTHYTLDDDTGKLTFLTAPGDGLTIFARGEASAFSDTELNDIITQNDDSVLQATLHCLRLLMSNNALRERWRAGDLESDPRSILENLAELYRFWLEQRAYGAIGEGGVEEWAVSQAEYT